ncbi:ras-related protein Rab-34-like [Octopus vulgaris]|uniref:Ras-related protein Rab-36 n=1 Tax=Octopus vulgaris TaxID=6645 RepID=A0AA36F6F1_OCTVU|nr:ras-related protein Rab-34-like [Octopus vulgaris]
MPHNNVRILITPNAAKDRVISKFPPAFHPDGTPYLQTNFHPKVKNACSENRTGRVSLRISKAVIVGDISIGKTSMVNRFCHNIFDRDYKATIGVDFEVEKFSILSAPFTLQLWDTAGQERFKCIAASYYRGANLLITAFDLSNISTLHTAVTWMTDAAKNADNPCRFLVGTKKDTLSEAAYRNVELQAIEVANSIDAEYWALSSKTGENVKEFFFRAVSLAFDRAVLRELEPTDASGKKIGNNIFKINREDSNLFEKSRSGPKCCH